MKKAWIQVEYEDIPKDDAEFVKWCWAHPDLKISSLNGARRGWSTTLGEYVRSNDALMYIDGAPAAFTTTAELFNNTIWEEA